MAPYVAVCQVSVCYLHGLAAGAAIGANVNNLADAVFYSSKGNGFFFSTQDLSTLDLVYDFKKMGIASLKIEGRLRKADYIRNAVTAYRMLLDADKPDKKLMGEARRILSGTYGRKWSHGFYSQKSAKDLIKHDAPGAAGLLCGRVELVEENGFGFKTSNRIYLGDRIRVQPTTGDEGPAMTVTRMSVNGRRSMKATSGQECFIFCDKEIPHRGLVYKIGESFDDNAKPPCRASRVTSCSGFANRYKS